MMKKSLLILSVLFLFVACVSKPKSSFSKHNSTPSPREVIYVNADTTVYFIDPIKLESKEKNSIAVDYTYLFSKKSPNNQVKVCFTINSKVVYEKVNSISIKYDQGTYESQKLELMFQEMKKKDKFVFRYNFFVDKEKMIQISKSKTLSFIINNKEEFYSNTKTWSSQSTTINYSLQNL